MSMNKSVAEMELEKYRRAIRSSVSALGYRELKKEEEIILRFISGNQNPLLRLIPTLEALLKKKTLQTGSTCFEESLSNKQRSLTFNASPQARQMTAIHSRFSSHEESRTITGYVAHPTSAFHSVQVC